MKICISTILLSCLLALLGGCVGSSGSSSGSTSGQYTPVTGDAVVAGSDAAAAPADSGGGTVDAGGGGVVDAGGGGVVDAGGGGAAAIAKYKAKCGGCHGEDGQGTKYGYELQHPVADYAKWVIRNGRPGIEFDGVEMPAFGAAAFSDGDIEQLVQWLSAKPKPTTGKALYADFCANCHGPKAKGGVSGESIAKAKLNKVTKFVRSGRGGNKYSDRQKYMPKWTSDELSNAELKLIVDALPTL